ANARSAFPADGMNLPRDRLNASCFWKIQEQVRGGSRTVSTILQPRIGSVNYPLTRPPATLSPSDGEREEVRGRLTRIFHAPHKITTACSHRREEVDRCDPHFCPPPHVGGYAGCEISRLEFPTLAE